MYRHDDDDPLLLLLTLTCPIGDLVVAIEKAELPGTPTHTTKAPIATARDDCNNIMIYLLLH